MIRITTIPTSELHADPDGSVRIWVTGRADLLKLQALINRALNTAPEFGEDWFALAEKLDKFIADNNIR